MVDTFSHLIKQLQEIQSKLPTAIEQAVVQTAVEGAVLARENMKFKHNGSDGLNSPKNTYGEQTGPMQARLIANTFYATWVEFGNGPPGGRIYPKNAKVLRFQMNGQWLYRKWVSTSSPKPFMAPTAVQLTSLLPLNIEKAWQKVLSEIS